MNGGERSFALCDKCLPGGTVHAPPPGWRFPGCPDQVRLPSLQSVSREDGLNELRGKSGFTDKCVESVERPTQ